MLMRIKTRPTPATDRKKTLHGIKKRKKEDRKRSHFQRAGD